MELKRALQLRPALSQNTTQADIKNEKDVALAPSEAFRLLDLPRELIGQVFENVPRSGLGRLEQVCNLMKDLVRPAYKHAVGPRPWQREVNGIDYRALAVAQGEMQQTLRSEAENQRDDPSLKWSAEFVMSRLTNNDYLKLDTDLVVCAEKALCVLQKSSARGSSGWTEAVATALMAQRRFAEAGPYFKNLTAGETPLPPRTLLTAARFGWPFDHEMPADVPQEMRELALVGAAAAGLVDVIRELNVQGARFGVRANGATAATIAAARGHVQVLRFLQEQGDNLLAARAFPFNHLVFWEDAPLFHAAQNGQVAAAEFLLSLGAQPAEAAPGPTNKTPYVIALQAGHKEIVRLFIQYEQALANAVLPSGDLQIEAALDTDLTFEQQKDVLSFLVDELHLDMNATNSQGQAAVHVAASMGSVALMETVLEGGADVEQLNAHGWSAFEIAVSEKQFYLVAWLAKRLKIDPASKAAEHLEMASAVFLPQRDRTLRLIAAHLGHTFAGRTTEEKLVHVKARWESFDMDQKVAKIWATNFPSACLLDFKDNVLGSELKEIFGLWAEIAARGLTPEEAGTHGHTVDNPYLPLARVVAKAMTPTIAEKLSLVDVVAQRGLKEMSLERIQKLHDYLTSPPGKAFCSGLIRKATEQSLLTADFLPPLI